VWCLINQFNRIPTVIQTVLVKTVKMSMQFIDRVDAVLNISNHQKKSGSNKMKRKKETKT